jgi:proteic killer suppression protein
MMELTFDKQRLQKICNSASKLNGEYGPRMAAVIRQRLFDLAAAENLDVMRSLPGRCHELTQNLAGLLAMDLVHPDRLVFRPTDEPPPEKADGGLDWSRVTRITIVGIGDYH